MSLYQDLKKKAKLGISLFLIGSGLWFYNGYQEAKSVAATETTQRQYKQIPASYSGLEDISLEEKAEAKAVETNTEYSKPQVDNAEHKANQRNYEIRDLSFCSNKDLLRIIAQYEKSPLLEKMGKMIYGEGRGCSDEEKIAIGYTVPNRAYDNLKYNCVTLRGVIDKPWAYSALWEKNENSRKTKSPKKFFKNDDSQSYRERLQDYLKCLQIADGVLKRKYPNPLEFKLPNGEIVKGNLYHTREINPYWNNKSNVIELPTSKDWAHKYYIEFNPREINEIVVHTTEIPLEQTLEWFGSRKNTDKIRAHYIIKENGEIIYYTPEPEKANHCIGHNANSIGIEVVGTYKQPISGNQLNSLISLVSQTRKKYNIPKSKVHGHYELDPSRRKDPGIENMKVIRQHLSQN